MFTEVSKLLDRNFAIAYVLPSALGWLIVLGMLDVFQIRNVPQFFAGSQAPLVETAVFAFTLWATAAALNALNSWLMMIFSGYFGYLNPINWWYAVLGDQRKHYRTLYTNLKKYREQPDAADQNSNSYKEIKRTEYRLAKEFSDREDKILHTGFGNAIRAFESYPRVMYGLEGVEGWYRLQWLIPYDYLGLLENAKAKVDLWLNLRLVSFITVVIYLYSMYRTEFKYPAIPVLALIAQIFFSRMAVRAAIEWGEVIKSAYDMYIPDLIKKLGYAANTDAKIRAILGNFSLAILYRDTSYLASQEFSAPSGADEEAQ